jgi:DNA-binding PadR family transcriptional regulator
MRVTGETHGEIYSSWIYSRWIDSGGARVPDSNATPPRPAVFHILLALAGGDLHGLGIADEVERATDGTVELGPGTLYRSLKQMAAEGLVQETVAPSPETDPRRKYYRATAEGRRVLAEEAGRLARIVEVARDRHVLPGSA